MVFSFLPKQWLNRLCPPGKALAWNIFLSNFLLLLLGFAASWSVPAPGALAGLPSFCLMQAALGLPCPGCGITRGLLHVFAGRFGLAMASNPAALPLAIFVLIQFLAQGFTLLAGLDPDRPLRLYRLMQIPLLACLLLFWAWQLLFQG